MDEYGDLLGLQPLAFRDERIPCDLYYTPASLPRLSAATLDPLAALAGRVVELDVTARAAFTTDVSTRWLADGLNPNTWADPALHTAVIAQLDLLFPGVRVPEDVSLDRFVSALRLDRACLSIAPEGASGAAITLDYRILPNNMDNYLFAAKFAADGALMSIDTES